MTTVRILFLAWVSIIVGGCATVESDPVGVDTGAPAVAELDDLRATLRVVSNREADQVFGRKLGSHLGIVELSIANRRSVPVSIERKSIYIVTPVDTRIHALAPIAVANASIPGEAMIATGANAFDWIQVAVGLARLAENHEIAAKWDCLMPEAVKLARGEEARKLLAFPTPQWAPGTWRLELPFNTETGAAEPQLSVPLTFKAMARRPAPQAGQPLQPQRE